MRCLGIILCSAQYPLTFTLICCSKCKTLIYLRVLLMNQEYCLTCMHAYLVLLICFATHTHSLRFDFYVRKASQFQKRGNASPCKLVDNDECCLHIILTGTSIMLVCRSICWNLFIVHFFRVQCQ